MRTDCFVFVSQILTKTHNTHFDFIERICVCLFAVWRISNRAVFVCCVRRKFFDGLSSSRGRPESLQAHRRPRHLGTASAVSVWSVLWFAVVSAAAFVWSKCNCLGKFQQLPTTPRHHTKFAIQSESVALLEAFRQQCRVAKKASSGWRSWTASTEPAAAAAACTRQSSVAMAVW